MTFRWGCVTLQYQSPFYDIIRMGREQHVVEEPRSATSRVWVISLQFDNSLPRQAHAQEYEITRARL